MRQICPVQNSNSLSGFSLVEVIVAVAVVALITAAATTAILVSQKFAFAASFDHKAATASVQIYAKAYRLPVDDYEYLTDNSTVVEHDKINATDGTGATWTRYRIRQPGGSRSVIFAIANVDGD